MTKSVRQFDGEEPDKASQFDPLVTAYLKSIRGSKPLSREQERVLGRRIRGGDWDAVKQLVTANLRFVVKHVKKYRQNGIPFIDLIGEGNIGLIEAAKRFDDRKKTKFITYAVFWIRNKVMEAFARDLGVCCVSTGINMRRMRMKEITEELARELERPPTRQELAHRMGIWLQEFELIMQVSEAPLSLGTVIDEDHDFELAEAIEQKTFRSPERDTYDREVRKHIRAALGSLSPKHQKALMLRYGIFDGKERTLDEVGQLMRLSRERIRQLQEEAIEMINQGPHQALLQQLYATV